MDLSCTESNLLITNQTLSDTSSEEVYLSVPNHFFKTALQNEQLLAEALTSEHFLNDHNYHHTLAPDSSNDASDEHIYLQDTIR